jgi:signal transduction histidine kinase
MERTEQGTASATANSTLNGVERRRVEKVVETLAALRGRGESVSAVAHDARNMVTALMLYCDLLEEPGVLAAPFAHYAQELRLVATASRRLVEKLVALDAGSAAEGVEPALLQSIAEHRAAAQAAGSAKSYAAAPGNGTSSDGNSAAGNAAPSSMDARTAVSESISPIQSPGRGPGPAGTRNSTAKADWIAGRDRRWDLEPAMPISNLAAELNSNRNLLSALAGPAIALTIEAGGAHAVRLTGEDLTRLLVNLVKNAAESMPRGGRIHIGLAEQESVQGSAPCLALTIEDNGPGIPEEALEKIFNSGYTTRGAETGAAGWTGSHRGLGLAIVRSIVEGAGGRIAARNRLQGGACFTLELPVRELPVRKAGNRVEGTGYTVEGRARG